jgi:hypothetical protein
MIANCSVTGTVSGERFLGGLIGENDGVITNCLMQGTVIGTDDLIGGIAGASGDGGEIHNSYVRGSVCGNWRVGGVAGQNGSRGTISNCHSIADVKGGDNVGGCVGDNSYNSHMFDCYSTGSVDGTDVVGGLVGFNYQSSISNSYSSANVKGVQNVGGCVGENASGSSLHNCYSIANVEGTDSVGGCVGSNRWASLSNCYAAAVIDGNDYTGGVVGYDRDGTSYTRCFYDVDVNQDMNGIGNTTDPNIIAESTEKMQKAKTFINAGWDFIEVWDIGESQTYPFLRVYPAGDINHDRIVNLFDFAIIADQWINEE